MGRVLAPVLGVVGLVCLVAGLAWAEFDQDTMVGVRLVALGAVGLLLGAVVVGVVELGDRRRR